MTNSLSTASTFALTLATAFAALALATPAQAAHDCDTQELLEAGSLIANNNIQGAQMAQRIDRCTAERDIRVVEAARHVFVVCTDRCEVRVRFRRGLLTVQRHAAGGRWNDVADTGVFADSRIVVLGTEHDDFLSVEDRVQGNWGANPEHPSVFVEALGGDDMVHVVSTDAVHVRLGDGNDIYAGRITGNLGPFDDANIRGGAGNDTFHVDQRHETSVGSYERGALRGEEGNDVLFGTCSDFFATYDLGDGDDFAFTDCLGLEMGDGNDYVDMRVVDNDPIAASWNLGPGADWAHLPYFRGAERVRANSGEDVRFAPRGGGDGFQVRVHAGDVEADLMLDTNDCADLVKKKVIGRMLTAIDKDDWDSDNKLVAGSTFLQDRIWATAAQELGAGGGDFLSLAKDACPAWQDLATAMGTD